MLFDFATNARAESWQKVRGRWGSKGEKRKSG
jgi:hypothetical protein